MSSLLTRQNIGRLLLLWAAYKTARVLLPAKVKSFDGKTVLITGAASGLGRALAVLLAERKNVAAMILWDIQAEQLEKTVQMIKERNANVRIFTQIVNLANREQIYTSADLCITSLLNNQSPDVIVNNAGIISGGCELLKTDDERIELEMKINTMSHIWITKAFLPKMIERGTGHFLNVASMAAYVSAPDMISYAVSKKGAKAFAEGLSAELKQQGHRGIKVSLLCPSHIDTPLFKGFNHAGNMTMSPEYVASHIIQAIECETELVCLPRFSPIFVLIIGLNEFWGSLNLPNPDGSPMKKWQPQQADRVFASIQKSTL
uniref:Uncharacterized protein n=1 Tax=Aplanochytrium stocchinoi TaxID=215587 RepID=A0A7S3PQN1_9STRA|mmetsp:Transcript_15391/g.18190  ORF Transcript_15391/g.18190 Transcript_15391/m.18190 type:complete len:318 (-) Transcript_15391:1661-2614(-)